MKAKYDNLEMVLHVARKFGDLLEKVVFLGGSATGLFYAGQVFGAGGRERRNEFKARM